jgi:hypothetical protein
MIKKIKNKIFPKNNRHLLFGLMCHLEEIRKDSATLVLYGSPTEGNWKGIAHATVGLYPSNSLEIPQWYSNPVLTKSETIQLCKHINALNFERIVFSGFAPYLFTWMELMHEELSIEVLYHGTISEFHDVNQQNFIQQLIAFGKNRKIKRFGFVKIGFAEVFIKLYDFDCYYQPLAATIIPKGIKKINLDTTKIHIGVFGADTFNKNLHNQVIHALMIDKVIVHVLDKTVFYYLDMGDRIIEHGKNLQYEQFMGILGSMDLNLYMSFNESWGLVAKESEAMGVKALNIENINYLKSIQLGLEITDLK